MKMLSTLYSLRWPLKALNLLTYRMWIPYRTVLISILHSDSLEWMLRGTLMEAFQHIWCHGVHKNFQTLWSPITTTAFCRMEDSTHYISLIDNHPAYFYFYISSRFGIFNIHMHFLLLSTHIPIFWRGQKYVKSQSILKTDILQKRWASWYNFCGQTCPDCW